MRYLTISVSQLNEKDQDFFYFEEPMSTEVEFADKFEESKNEEDSGKKTNESE